MDHGKRPRPECPHQGCSKSRSLWERWVASGNSSLSCSSIISMTSFLRRTVGSSVGGEVISLSSSSSLDGESKAGPCGGEHASLVLPAGAIDKPVIIGRHMMSARLVSVGPNLVALSYARGSSLPPPSPLMRRLARLRPWPFHY